jgi:geranylgeranyl reductase family protein
MWDVLIAGAGPAGSVAATILARAGARVLVVDRARFPRGKLCGDSINPGTLAVLRRHRLANQIDTRGLPIDGMLVTGPGGVRVEGRYPAAMHGRTVVRRDLDQWLVDEALRAGAQLDEGVTVRRACVQQAAGAARVTGVVTGRGSSETILSARVVIAADGRRSSLAFSLGLARHPPRPRRWAVGAYFAGVSGHSSLGEMHIRSGEYIGIAPIGGDLTNACLVTRGERLTAAGTPERALVSAIARDPVLRERFAAARIVTPPVVLGPLAVDVERSGPRGLLLAGDAAGFVDPMTGDGLRFALRGAELAADAALDMLQHGAPDAHVTLALRRREAFAGKWRFNRLLRRMVDLPAVVGAAALGASLAPSLVRSLVAVAGDCGEARCEPG